MIHFKNPIAGTVKNKMSQTILVFHTENKEFSVAHCCLYSIIFPIRERGLLLHSCLIFGLSRFLDYTLQLQTFSFSENFSLTLKEKEKRKKKKRVTNKVVYLNDSVACNTISSI